MVDQNLHLLTVILTFNNNICGELQGEFFDHFLYISFVTCQSNHDENSEVQLHTTRTCEQ